VSGGEAIGDRPAGSTQGSATVRGRVRVLLTGTDPERPRGGIGVAMSGFRAALESEGLLETLVPSYRPDSLAGRTTLALEAAAKLRHQSDALRAAGGVPVVYAHGGAGVGLLRQSLVLAAARRRGAVTILHVHAPEVDRYVQTSRGRWFLRRCCAAADVACVLTPWWRDRLSMARLRPRVEVVPDPISPDLVSVARAGRPASREDGERIRVLAMSRLVKGKGVDIALRALSLVPPDFRLTIAGDGAERARFERLAGELGLRERVRFTGWVSGRRKHELLCETDVFCLPTTNDSFCMGFIEAMAYGLPVIAASWGPIPDVVQDDVTGLLVPVGAPNRVARALERLADPGLRRRLGEGGRTWVLASLTPREVGRTLREVVNRARVEAGRRGRADSIGS